MIENSEILRRRDMRDVFTFTIDPADAKDFDDAISFEILNSSDDETNDQTANAYPAFGDIDMIHLPALQVQHANGDLSLNLIVESQKSKVERLRR